MGDFANIVVRFWIPRIEKQHPVELHLTCIVVNNLLPYTVYYPTNQFAGLEAGLLREADTQAVAYASQDFVRGIEAVKAKASPKFLGWEEEK